ncbi:MAG: sialidase family protein [candidate division WOR-3 bacterium]
MLLFLVLDSPFGSEVKMTPYSMASCASNYMTDIKKVGNTVLATWARTDNGGVYVNMSFDGGNAFGAIQIYSGDPNCFFTDPAIAIQPDDPNILFFAFATICGFLGTGEVRVYRCTSGSGCFDPANWSSFFVGPNDNYQYYKGLPQILALGNNTVLVNFATDKFSPGETRLVIYRSTDNGASWNQVGSTNFPSTLGYFAKDGSNIYMSYNDLTYASSDTLVFVGFMRSTDNGLNFFDIAWTSFNFGSSLSCPSYYSAKEYNNITASNGKVAISYVDGNCKANIGIYKGGLGFDTTYPIASIGGGTQQVIPMLASSGNKIFVQWQGRIGNYGSCGGYPLGTWATYWAVSNDWGQSFSAPQRVSSGDYPFYEPGYGYKNGWIIDNGYIYTTWGNDYRDDYTGDVYYSRTTISALEEIVNKKKPYSIKYQSNKVIISSKAPFTIYRANGEKLISYKEGNYQLNLKSGIYFIKSNNFEDKIIIR